ncbi:unnamed protein product [Ophioblennius macclurei]
MPSERMRWETLEALRNSEKGKLKYDSLWSQRGQDIMCGYMEELSLSSGSGQILDHLGSQPLQSCSFLSPSPDARSPPAPSQELPASASSSSSVLDLGSGLGASSRSEWSQAVSEDDEDENPEPAPLLPPALLLRSPRAMEIDGCIIRLENEFREKAKLALRLRQETQEQLVAAVALAESEQLKRFNELMELKQRQEFQTMRDMMDRETKESMGRQEKLKEEQRHRMKIMNLRLREAEQQRLREVELEKQRQAEGRDRLRSLNSIQEEILQLNQLLEPCSASSSSVARGNQLCSQVSQVVRKTTEGEFPSVEDMTVAERALHEMRVLIRLTQEEAARAQEEAQKEQEEERRKQVEQEAQQEAQKKAAQQAKEKAQKRGLQNNADDVTLKWSRELQVAAAASLQSFQTLSCPQDSQSKKLKLELQKAATLLVSQISSNSGSQLREVFDKIDKLLSGRSVSTSQHPQGLSFVSYKLAEKFVKQGEEEVAFRHEAAFPIAVVASGVWELHPQVGDFILAHLHKKCPYAVPHYPPMKDGTKVEDYQRILGYRVDESGVEGQDSFLKRMSGMIRLYAAIIQLRWPYSAKQGSSPHGLNHGWRWLAQMLNMEPLADVSATLLFDFLEVCGSALMKLYQGQFWKLILLLKEEYLPRIEAVTSSGQMGSLNRLKLFVETSLQNRQICEPKGQLSPGFWRS